MAEKKKRVAKYNPEAEKRYVAKMSPEQRAERNRRTAFTTALNFVKKEKYTAEELEELAQAIEEKKGKKNGNN
ncbi:MAG: hypothetical protein LBI43_05145 [Streptococcaceae bacterium]|jgi:predicted transcriptional regulator|nr:hypothetical protein [Streptococcaceae bacterium]